MLLSFFSKGNDFAQEIKTRLKQIVSQSIGVIGNSLRIERDNTFYYDSHG